MPNYVRARIPGATYFFTVTTQNRQPVLIRDDVRAALRAAIHETRERWPFTVDAWVLLPDHMHCLWTLPDDDADYSKRWALIKRRTTQRIGRTIWQPRFWEHVIRDEEDRERHFHYIHRNPVKHGYAPTAAQWPFSTFSRFVNQGVYPPDWLDMRDDLDLD